MLLRVAGAGAIGAAASIAGCGSHKSAVTATSTTTETPGPDVPILNGVLELEHMAVSAYTAGLPLLSGAVHMAGQRFLIQELSHAGEIEGLVRQAGGKPLKAKASYDFGRPSTALDVLWLLHGLEQAQVAAYVNAIPRLSTPAVRAAASAILANDAQHLSILRYTLGRNPIPSAFVNGHE